MQSDYVTVECEQGTWNVIMGKWNVKCEPWNVMMGPLKVNKGPWNVIIGPRNVNRVRAM